MPDSNKPEYLEGLNYCPICKGVDNTSLALKDASLTWCSCGAVYVYNKEKADTLKIVYQF